MDVTHARTMGLGDTPPRTGDHAWFRREFYDSLPARADQHHRWIMPGFRRRRCSRSTA